MKNMPGLRELAQIAAGLEAKSPAEVPAAV
jgi:hypothetical protein